MHQQRVARARAMLRILQTLSVTGHRQAMAVAQVALELPIAVPPVALGRQEVQAPPLVEERREDRRRHRPRNHRRHKVGLARQQVATCPVRGVLTVPAVLNRRPATERLPAAVMER